jgi:hypothetical protein
MPCARLATTEDTVHVLQVTQEIQIVVDVLKFLRSFLTLAVKKIENAKASMHV